MKRYLTAMTLLLSAGVLCADIVVPKADGSDGDLVITSSLEIDLGKAWAGDDGQGVTWDTRGGDRDGDGRGDGVYDPEKWAVVFKWKKVEIKNGATLRFKNHPTNAPVVWLVETDCVVEKNCSIVLDGANGHAWNGLKTNALPGPGGFRGGRGCDVGLILASSGFGVGGGGPEGFATSGGGGGHSDRAGEGAQRGRYNGGATGVAGVGYNNASTMPLIGGAGGGGGDNWFTDANRAFSVGGGAGGGAILVASSRAIQVDGAILSRGGNGGAHRDYQFGLGGGGGGGAIRLVSFEFRGIGRVNAQGGRGSFYNDNWRGGDGAAGRIRIETTDGSGFTGEDSPEYSGLQLQDGATAELWPGDSGEAAPTLRVVGIAGKNVPDDPRAGLGIPADVSLREKGEVELLIAAENVPRDWVVTIRVVPKSNGIATTYSAEPVGGDGYPATWKAKVTLADGVAAISVRAAKP